MSDAARPPDSAKSGVDCSLSEAAQRSRRRELAAGLAGSVREIRELSHGYALAFDRRAEQEVHAFVEFERACCGFLDFDLRDENDAGRLWLVLTGPDGSKEFLRGWIDSVRAVTGATAPGTSSDT